MKKSKKLSTNKIIKSVNSISKKIEAKRTELNFLYEKLNKIQEQCSHPNGKDITINTFKGVYWHYFECPDCKVKYYPDPMGN